MALQFKLPLSRRQAWKNKEHIDQLSFPSISKNQSRKSTRLNVDEVDGEDVGRRTNNGLSSAGAPLPHIYRHSHFKESEEPPYLQKGDSPDSTKITVDCLPDKIPFSVIDLIFVIISIVLYVVDIGLDCFVAYKHYLNISVNPLYFYFTLAFVVLSAIITDIFSLWWYYFEYRVKKETEQELPSKHWIVIRLVGSILLLGPVLRYIDTIRYGLQGRKKHLTSEQRRWYHMQMQYERVDGAMLRLFEAFVEAAPQTLLQLYIILEQGLEGEKDQNVFLSTYKLLHLMFI